MGRNLQQQLRRPNLSATSNRPQGQLTATRDCTLETLCRCGCDGTTGGQRGVTDPHEGGGDGVTSVQESTEGGVDTPGIDGHDESLSTTVADLGESVDPPSVKCPPLPPGCACEERAR